MIRIEPGCIVCGLCEAYCSAVFRVEDDGSVVIAQPTIHEWPDVMDAIDDCPVSVIVDDGRVDAATDEVEHPAD